MERVIAEPTPVYPVAYNGSMVQNELLTIPNKHRRETDLGDNEQVRVLVQNVSSFFEGSETVNAPNPIIRVLDDTNSEIFRVYASRAETFETPRTLKLYPTVYPDAGMPVGATTAYFNVVVFYKKPDDR